MKTLLLATVFLVATSTVTISNHVLDDVAVSAAVKKTFLAEFGTVYQVTWKKTAQGMLRADFLMDGEATTAFFYDNGDLQATTIQKRFEDLPNRLKKRIQETFGPSRPTEIFELIHENEQAYFFVMDDKANSTIYKGYGSGHFKRHLP